MTTPGPDGAVSGRWVCSTCEREFEPREVAYARGVDEGTRAQKSAILYTVGGTVEGHPTSAINYLQRLRQLMRVEKAAKEIADWHAVEGNTGHVSADHLDALCDALGDGPITDEPYVVSLRADFERLTRENEKYRADWNTQAGRANGLADELAKFRANFARDQAELASMRITLAEAKADLEQAAKVACELVDGLSEETRKRQVAEVELERERMRLVACGVVALANTHESSIKARDMLPEYWSASCRDVARVVDSEMALRREVERLQKEVERLQKEVERLGGAPF